jgi:hypothetical protein
MISEYRRPMKLSVIRLGLCCLVATVGCTKSPATYPVEGLARFKGAPIKSGTMTLIPKSPQARTTVSQIVNGKYSMKVVAGDWTVNIRAVREKEPVDPKAREAPREQYIPAKYNGDSKVVVTLPSEKKEFNYNLEP